MRRFLYVDDRHRDSPSEMHVNTISYVLSAGDTLELPGEYTIRIMQIQKNKIRLAIEAAPSTPIRRGELDSTEQTIKALRHT